MELDRHLGLLMLDWCTHKDLSRIACWIEPALLGTFVKAVMRVVSYIEVLKEVVLGLGFYEVCITTTTTTTTFVHVHVHVCVYVYVDVDVQGWSLCTPCAGAQPSG